MVGITANPRIGSSKLVGPSPSESARARWGYRTKVWVNAKIANLKQGQKKLSQE